MGALFGWICVLWWKRKEEKEEAECFGVFPLGYLCSLFGRRYRDSWKDICSPKKNGKNKKNNYCSLLQFKMPTFSSGFFGGGDNRRKRRRSRGGIEEDGGRRVRDDTGNV